MAKSVIQKIQAMNIIMEEKQCVRKKDKAVLTQMSFSIWR